MPDEPYLAFYRALPKEGIPLLVHLMEAFPQLRFSPTQGLSQTPEWERAVRRGERATDQGPPPLQAPEALTLQLVPTPAGTLPTVIAGCREDFVRLVQLLGHRGEPTAIPQSMGACLLQGLNNWQRYRALRQAWEQGEMEAIPWPQVLACKKLYQDRLVLASRGPYSGVEVPENAETAEQKALTIRLHHEAAHYVTVRVFGKLGHTLLEELVADWYGLQAAYGHYDAPLALQFLGLEAFPAVRPTGRVLNYRSTPPTCDDAFQFLAAACCHAVHSLSTLGSPQEQEKAALLPSLLSLSLEELALGRWNSPLLGPERGRSRE